MPEYSRTFRVRYYECDAYGHLNNAVYLRYMQEAAFDASADAGYDLARYEQMGVVWLVRDTTLRYRQPVVYGDAVTVTTRVRDMSKVRSIREYEMVNAATGEVVAEGHSDWAYIDVETGRPTPIPAEMKAAFYPVEDGQRCSRKRFPPAPPPPPGAFTLRRKVEWADVDPQQHVNNAMYLTYIEEAAVQGVASFGWGMRRMLEQGLAFVATEHRIAYDRPAQPTDTLLITTYLSDVRRASGTRHFTITREGDGTRIARAYTRWASVDSATGRPRRMPAEVIDAFADHVVG